MLKIVEQGLKDFKFELTKENITKLINTIIQILTYKKIYNHKKQIAEYYIQPLFGSTANNRIDENLIIQLKSAKLVEQLMENLDKEQLLNEGTVKIIIHSLQELCGISNCEICISTIFVALTILISGFENFHDFCIFINNEVPKIEKFVASNSRIGRYDLYSHITQYPKLNKVVLTTSFLAKMNFTRSKDLNITNPLKNVTEKIYILTSDYSDTVFMRGDTSRITTSMHTVTRKGLC
jgi:predicted transcriptional regulator